MKLQYGFSEFVETTRELINSQRSFVVVTLASLDGHVPQNLGARALIGAEGLLWGTVGGGRLEAKAIDVAKSMLAAGTSMPTSIHYDLRRDLEMVCGGTATLLYEPHGIEPWNIAVFGAGHVAQAVVPLLSTLSCQIHQIDDRADWLAKIPSKANIIQICHSEPAAVVSQLSDDCYFVVMTQGHATDLPIVRAILRGGNPNYLGVIGSSTKARSLKAQLLQDGISREKVDAICSPIGLPIGSNQPGEIAISVAAQLIQRRQELQPSRNRMSIHDEI